VVDSGGASCGRSGGCGEAAGVANGGGRGLNAVSTGGAVVQTRRLMGWPQRFQIFFSNLSKISSTLKIKMGALS
jgi:hypothetical protein